MRCFRKTIAVAGLLVSGFIRAQGQEIVAIDWLTKTLTSAPSVVNQATPVTVSVMKVNDFVYQYQISIKETPRAVDDFANIPTSPPATVQAQAAQALAAAQPTCNQRASAAILKVPFADAQGHPVDVKTFIEKNLFPQPDSKGNYASLLLATTIATWNQSDVMMQDVEQTVQALRSDMRQGSPPCRDQTDISDAQQTLAAYFDPVESQVNQVRDKLLKSPHRVDVPYTFRADNDYTVTVTETFNGQTTASKDFTISPASTILTLSGGPLFTTIADRSYVSRTVPAAAGATNNILGVEDASRARPALVALLNYRIPFPNWGELGKLNKAETAWHNGFHRTSVSDGQQFKRIRFWLFCWPFGPHLATVFRNPGCSYRRICGLPGGVYQRLHHPYRIRTTRPSQALDDALCNRSHLQDQ